MCGVPCFLYGCRFLRKNGGFPLFSGQDTDVDGSYKNLSKNLKQINKEQLDKVAPFPTVNELLLPINQKKEKSFTNKKYIKLINH